MPRSYRSLLGPVAVSLSLSAGGCGPDDTQVIGVVRCAPGDILVRGVCQPEADDVGSAELGDTIGEDGVESTDTPNEVIAIDLGQLDTNTDSGGGGGDCTDGATGCSDLGVPTECVDGVWIDRAACPGSEICVGGRCVDGAGCEPGFVIGCWDVEAQRVCNAAGTNYERVDCPDDLVCFRGACGTQICEPGQLGCSEEGRWVELCAPSGEEWVRTTECNPRDDLTCVAGECVSGCAAALKNPAYIGCEYWSVDLPQFQDPFGDPRAVPHAVVLANTGDRTAEITIDTRGDIPPVTSRTSIAAGEVGTITFPRADVENTSRSLRSFRITTTEPVVVYQFNPLNDVGVASNDASLLLPASAIGREYYVMTWPSGIEAMGFGAQTGWFTVVAVREGTTRVTITFSASLLDTAGVTPTDLRGILAGSTHTFEMDQYEVLNFEAVSRLFAIGDLTGTHIEADRPIVVFGGHEEAVLGESGPDEDGGPCCADHLEEQLFPVETWGTRILAVHSPPRGTEKDYWRVVASAPDTRLTTIPPISGLDGIRLGAGEFVEVSTTQSFEIVATQPIMVGQFLVSQQDAGIARTKGDPSFILAVPSEQYRSDYAVLVPRDYAEDWITVVRPAGAEVLLDGVAIPDAEFTPFGTFEFEYSYRSVEPGPHSLVCPSEEKFGIVGIGYDSAVSYGYPGGLNLATEFEITPP